MRCSTRSGRFQCKKEEGHADECEADDAPIARAFGPYVDRSHSRAYLRGMLDVQRGAELDATGNRLGVPRLFTSAYAEPDDRYRERIWRMGA